MQFIFPFTLRIMMSFFKSVAFWSLCRNACCTGTCFILLRLWMLQSPSKTVQDLKWQNEMQIVFWSEHCIHEIKILFLFIIIIIIIIVLYFVLPSCICPTKSTMYACYVVQPHGLRRSRLYELGKKCVCAYVCMYIQK